MKNRQAYLVTGTGTGIGKTFVTCELLKKYAKEGKKVLGIKPIASGCQMTMDGLRNDDARQLMAASNMDIPYDLINPLAFEEAVSPNIAASQSGSKLSVAKILAAIAPIFELEWDILLIEGVGGWLVPFNDHETFEDLAKVLNLPVMLVVGLQLGCLNQGFLTFDRITHSGVPFHGWIANHIETDMLRVDENVRCLTHYFASAPLLRIPHSRCAFAVPPVQTPHG